MRKTTNNHPHGGVFAPNKETTVQTFTMDLSHQTMTSILDRFRALLLSEVERLEQDDGITLNSEVVGRVFTLLFVTSEMTHAHKV